MFVPYLIKRGLHRAIFTQKGEMSGLFQICCKGENYLRFAARAVARKTKAEIVLHDRVVRFVLITRELE